MRLSKWFQGKSVNVVITRHESGKKEQVQYHPDMQAKLLFETCEGKYANSMKFFNQEDFRLT